MATVIAHSALSSTRSLIFQVPRAAVGRWPRINLSRGHVRAVRCYAAVISREDKNGFLMGVDSSNVEVVNRVLEQARRAADRWEVAHSDFLTPPTLSDVLLVLRRAADFGIVVSGGYPESDAEFLWGMRKL